MHTPCLFRDCSNDIRRNREIALLAVKLNKNNIEYECGILKDDREIIMVSNNYNDKK